MYYCVLWCTSVYQCVLCVPVRLQGGMQRADVGDAHVVAGRDAAEQRSHVVQY